MPGGIPIAEPCVGMAFDTVLIVTTLGESVFAAPRKARDKLRASPFALSARASTAVVGDVAARATPSVAGLKAASGAQRRSALVAAIAERFAMRIESVRVYTS